ncbi:MAG: Coenzyme F420 hydrogenase/dehydrogenase, beta subunit C-terminal domain [Clostridia bacterium]|nr:Coenzyme F420 hydrogenase/dehydrogenase, beta subunit C-terminal domain [Clostridia bacterium]
MVNEAKTVADSENCCACMACLNVCPKKAIEFKPDNYGFLYPSVDKELCISCGKCLKACRFSKEELDAEHPQKCFAAVNMDPTVLKKSSSGGVFGALADIVLEEGGFVFGAAFDDDLNVHHICAGSKEELDKLRGSKYVQSSAGLSYSEVKDLLKDGKKVLFSGTPCQVDALKSVLDNTDTADLITVDLICHGTPNNLIFHRYLEYLENKKGGKITRYSFRSKARSWSAICSDFDCHTEDSGTRTIVLGRYDEFYVPEYLNGNLSRAECFSCKYASQNRVGDFTIGDFWGFRKGNITLEHKNGLSVCTANTDKAVKLLEKLKERMELQEVDYSVAVSGNEALRKPTTCGKRRERVLKLILAGKCKKVYREYRTGYYYKKIRKKIKAVFKHN